MQTWATGLPHFLSVEIQISVYSFSLQVCLVHVGSGTTLRVVRDTYTYIYIYIYIFIYIYIRIQRELRVALFLPGSSPLTLQGWLLPASSPGSSNQKVDGGVSIAVLAVHVLCDCGPLSWQRHKHTKGHTIMCQLLLHILTPLHKCLLLLTLQNPQVIVFYILSRIYSHQDKRWFVESLYHYNKLLLFETLKCTTSAKKINMI